MCDFSEIRAELRQAVLDIQANAVDPATGAPAPVNVYMFGPQGSGKSSFIRTCFRAVHGPEKLPPDIEELERVLHRTDDGTSTYSVYDLTSAVRLHDTRGQRAFSEQERAQLNLLLDGRAKPGEVVMQRKRYWLLLREFWKSDQNMQHAFSRSVMQESSLNTEPHFVFLVVDPNQQELLLEDADFRACYEDMLMSMKARGLPFAILCTHGDQLTPEMRQALHGLPDTLGLGVKGPEGPAGLAGSVAGYVSSSLGFGGPAGRSAASTGGTGNGPVDQEHVAGDGAPPPSMPEVLRIVTNYIRPSASGEEDAQQDIHTLLVLLDAVHQGEEHVQQRAAGARPAPQSAATPGQECVLL